MRCFHKFEKEAFCELLRKVSRSPIPCKIKDLFGEENRFAHVCGKSEREEQFREERRKGSPFEEDWPTNEKRFRDEAHTRAEDNHFSDFFPLLIRYSLFSWKVYDSVRGVTIELSDDLIQRKSSVDVEELIRRIREQLEKNDDPFLRKRLERLQSGATISDLLLGVYIHDEKKIILYMEAIKQCGATPFEVLAHELFHAYQANRTIRMQEKWNFAARINEITVESLAKENELLFMEMFDGDDLRAQKERYRLSQYDPEYYPYSGIIGLEWILGKEASMETTGIHGFGSYFLNSLIKAHLFVLTDFHLLNYSYM